jgi:ribonucleoside-diphosphate reductase alpha chain
MATAPQQLGIGIRRHFTRPGIDPYDTLEWERRDARIPNFKEGGDAFFQPEVEFPTSWSLNATNIVAQKYFRGTLGTAEREWSLRQVIDRVADTITDWGTRDGYFVDEREADAFRDELKYVLVHQRASFNSPVWFNIGVKGVPQQASACQPYDALVATPEGLIPIGRLVEAGAVGAKVIDAHGLTQIVAVKDNGIKAVLRVHTKAGVTLDVTADHVVWSSRTGRGSGWAAAGDLRPGDQLEWHRSESWGAGEISTSAIDDAARAGRDVASRVGARVSPELFTAPLPILGAYLRGVFDAGGYVAQHGHASRVGLDIDSEVLARELQQLLMRFGIFSRVRAKSARWTLSIQAAGDRLRFTDEIGFVNEHKAIELAASFDLPGNPDSASKRLEIDHIEELGAQRVYDIQTESGEYLSHHVRVHNCFILAVDDTMDGILNWYREEGTIFKGGSGAGINLSRIRSSKEHLQGGGTASGPVSFMRGADASAGTIKSGGKTRRAAKMVILDADHPDIEDFIWCKAVEERKARALAEAGFDMDLDGKDSHSIQYQNANNSVRVTDDFMQAVVDDRDWALKAVTSGEPVKTMKARDLMRQIGQSAWECADPGMQFDTTINRWHTASNTGRINASNPCSEYMHLDNSACNLASINLLHYLGDDGSFDVEAFKHTVEVVFTAQEILVGNADYPTEKIAQTSREFRQLGLGYANLGALLMAEGMPYDSDAGRAWAGAITALMTGHAYATSAKTAARMGPFAGYAANTEPMLNVLRMHRAEAARIDEDLVPPDLLSAAQEAWDQAVELGEQYGVRNSQASVLAPTGCLVGGTLVPTAHGLVRLGSLGDPLGEQWQALETDVQTDDGVRRATQFYLNGVEPVVSAETRRGYRLRGTVKHRIKIVDGDGAWIWRSLGDLRPGDRVPLLLGGLVGDPQVVALPPLSEHMAWSAERDVRVPEEMSPELAELVGYFMGDGSLHARGLRLCVSDGDYDVVEHLSLLAKSLFGVEATARAERGYTSVELNSVRLAQWWSATGFAKRRPAEAYRGKGYHPHIPDAVLWSNDPDVYAAFVRGLFEADGTASTGYPSWTSACEQFSRDVQTMLLALGFVTTRHWGTSGRGSRLAVLQLLNQHSAQDWLDRVGFISTRKTVAVVGGEHPQAARYDHIPVNRELIDRVAPTNDRTRRVAMMELRRSNGITRRLALEMYESTHDEELGRLLGFFYDVVATAELGEEEFTYDLSVPENVTYVANGFVSHNTIGLMMDCDTTGIEPDLALTKAKKLVGGGTMFIVNQTIPRALTHLGYSDDEVDAIVAYIDEHKTIIGAPVFKAEHLPVFACSMGDNTIHYMGHVKMMAAAQPFLSGAISKTVNMPEDVSVQDVEDLYIESWRLGLKAVALYRDNCKVAQPLATQKKAGDAVVQEVERIVETVIVQEPVRQKLPRTRQSRTFSFRVADCHGYVIVGEYADGRPGEVFLNVAKQGSTLAGIMDAFAISVSHGLQYGVPLEAFVEMFTNMRFEPAGMTDDPDIRFATSLVDYIFRRLAVEYLTYEKREAMGILTVGERTQPTLPGVEEAATPTAQSLDLPPDDLAPSAALDRPKPAPAPQAREREVVLCPVCGDRMQRAGSCYACPSCGSTSGCS